MKTITSLSYSKVIDPALSESLDILKILVMIKMGVGFYLHELIHKVFFF